jgi:hypothetical protein
MIKKFRAWDKDKKQMLEMPLDSYFGLSRFFGFIPHNAIVMQFTGRYNMWEGDICTATYICDVCFLDEPHILKGVVAQDDNGLWVLDYGHGYIPLDSEYLDNITIVGNIHQHPHLLEEK